MFKRMFQAVLFVSLVSAFIVSGVQASQPPEPMVQCQYYLGTCIDRACVGGSCMLVGNGGPCACLF